MKFATYSDLALRTCSLSPRTGNDINLACLDMAALGLVGEAAEVQAALDSCIPTWVAGFDYVHLRKEIGDVFWYVSLAAQVLDSSLEEIASQATGVWVVDFGDLKQPPETWYVKSLLGMLRSAGLFADEVKKILHHGHAVNVEKLIHLLVDTFFHLWQMCGNIPAWSVDLSLAADMNIERLRKRYPEGFRSDDSVNRVD